MKTEASSHFYQQLSRFGHRTAAIDAEQNLSYLQLNTLCQHFARQLQDTVAAQRLLLFIKAHNSVSTLVAYLSALQQRHVVMLVDPHIQQAKLDALVSAYQPNALIENRQIHCLHPQQAELAPALALLLSTSGSTGSPKQVCLSYDNIQANARSIGEYLPLRADDKTISTLPFFYSYGLSVINSHLNAGACVVLTQHSLLSREFWTLFKQQQITSFAGVPHSYEMLVKLRFEQMSLPHLRYFTQAGGKLPVALAERLANYARTSHKQFFVMYGQTEATARMAYLPAEQVLNKPGSIGRAIPGGRFELRDVQGNRIEQPGQAGELIYSGPNVMLGYANQLAELAVFSPPAELATGDLATCDEEGDYTICGRLKRFIKINGLRINLDDVEAMIASQGLESYCLGDDHQLVVVLRDATDLLFWQRWLSIELQLHHASIKVHRVSTFPVNANGKRDYVALSAQLDVCDV